MVAKTVVPMARMKAGVMVFQKVESTELTTAGQSVLPRVGTTVSTMAALWVCSRAG